MKKYCRGWSWSDWVWYILHLSCCDSVFRQRFASSWKCKTLLFIKLPQSLLSPVPKASIYFSLCLCHQIFWLTGVAILLGWRSTLQLFTDRRNYKVHTTGRMQNENISICGYMKILVDIDRSNGIDIQLAQLWKIHIIRSKAIWTTNLSTWFLCLLSWNGQWHELSKSGRPDKLVVSGLLTKE